MLVELIVFRIAEYLFKKSTAEEFVVKVLILFNIKPCDCVVESEAIDFP